MAKLLTLPLGIPYQFRDMIEKIQLMIGSGTPRFGKIPFRDGENQALVADIMKAKELLNWNPTTSIDEGIRMNS